MKKILIAIVGLLVLTGCGNRNIGFGKQTYNFITCEESYAPLQNATVDSWKDYDGEQIEIKSNGNTFLISANKCFMSTKSVEQGENK